MHIRTWFPLADTVDRAFECVYGEGAGDEQVEAFASHWGGLDLNHFRQALASGEGDEQLLAIFALGLTATPEAADLLAPFLSHPSRRQRWASAVCLGWTNDARAFPVLESLLLDGLDLEEYTREHARAYQDAAYDDEYGFSWGEGYRWHVIQLLEQWNTPTLVPTLKQTFVALWRVQQQLRPYGFEVACYDALAYALGQRGDFTVLNGLDLPPEHRHTAMIYLALGHLQAKAPPGSWLESEMIGNKPLRAAVASELEVIFGLSPEEQDAYLAHFYDNAHLRSKYGHLDSNPFDDADEDLDEEDEEGEEEEPEPAETSPLCVYQEHAARLQSLAWSPASTHLVSGSEDGTARVWNSATGETTTVFGGHTGSVNLVAWSPQSRWIASGGSDGMVCVWDGWTGEQVSTYRGHQTWIWGGLAWSPDGTKLASASLDRTVQVWDARSAETVLTYRGHAGIVTSLAWSPDGTRVASGGGYPECTIQVWDAQTGSLLLTYRDHQRDTDRQRPLFGHYEYEDGKEWARGASSVHGLAWSPDGTCLASAGLRSVCRVWDAQSGETLVASNRTDGPLAWSPESGFVCSSSIPYRVDIWKATTNQVVMSYHTRGMSDLKALGWSPDGSLLAASGSTTDRYGKATVQVWKANV